MEKEELIDSEDVVDSASFRDPNSRVLIYNDCILREFSREGKEEFLSCENTGLFDELIKKKFLLTYKKEIFNEIILKIKVNKLKFISYISEWCFEQIKAAALLTLQIEKISLKYKCTLKDASAYNIQFNNSPIFIDHGSFTPYVEGKPWIAYNQFCEHFLAPLVLISHYGLQPNTIAASSIEGIKVKIASKLLPFKNISTFIHIHLQNFFLKKYSKKNTLTDQKKISLKKRKLLVESLINFVENLNFKSHSSEWENYYLKNSNNYKTDSFQNKKEIISKFCKEIKFSKALDLGSNDGYFSRVIKENSDLVVSADFDHNAVNYNYVKSISKKESKLHALYLDIVNPTPAIGWLNNERKSFFDRADFDLVLGLALIHHLVITKGIPMFKVCEMFYKLTKRYVIIEFPDVSDSQVQLLEKWNTLYENKYSLRKFEEEFSKSFEIVEKLEIKNTKRILFLLRKLDRGIL